MSNQTFFLTYLSISDLAVSISLCNFIHIQDDDENTGFILIASPNTKSKIDNCFFYGCISINSNGIICYSGSQLNFTKVNFFNSFSKINTISMNDTTNMLDSMSYANSKLAFDGISKALICGIDNLSIKNINISNSFIADFQLLYDNITLCNISYLLINNSTSFLTLIFGQNLYFSSFTFLEIYINHKFNIQVWIWMYEL